MTALQVLGACRVPQWAALLSTAVPLHLLLVAMQLKRKAVDLHGDAGALRVTALVTHVMSGNLQRRFAQHLSVLGTRQNGLNVTAFGCNASSVSLVSRASPAEELTAMRIAQLCCSASASSGSC